MGKQIVSAAPGISLDWSDYKGKLLVIEPLEIEHRVTAFSKGAEQECVRANLFTVLNREGTQGEALEDILIFPRVLISQTKSQIGSLVVGRLGQGDAKPNQDPPWKLAEATPAQLTAASAYIASRSTVSATSGGRSAPADDGDEWDADGDSTEPAGDEF